MARDRKRAKQRRARRAQQAPAQVAGSQRTGDATTAPDPLEHASAEVDLAHAAIGVDAEPSAAPDDQPAAAPDLIEEAPVADDELAADELEGIFEDEYADEDEAERSQPVAAGARRRPASTGERRAREGSRFGNFLRACWAELKRVQWPDRRQVTQATGVVLGFVLIAGAYLGLLDAIFSRLVDRII